MQHSFYAVLHTLGLTQRNLRDISPKNVEEYYHRLDTQKLVATGFSMDRAVSIVDKKTDKTVEHVERTLASLQIRVVHRDDEDFPSLLRELPDCPTILYVRGILPPNDALISIVGSRKHSQYAVGCLEKIIPDLVRAGYGVIS